VNFALGGIDPRQIDPPALSRLPGTRFSGDEVDWEPGGSARQSSSKIVRHRIRPTGSGQSAGGENEPCGLLCRKDLYGGRTQETVSAKRPMSTARTSGPKRPELDPLLTCHVGRSSTIDTAMSFRSLRRESGTPWRRLINSHFGGPGWRIFDSKVIPSSQAQC
jgi:hypothetical protein